MKETYTVEGLGKVSLTDTDFLASGGEAQVFVKDTLAYKIYHDPKNMIPVDKIKELEMINCDNVLKPKHIIYEAAGNPVGYAMDFKKNTHALCKLFTKAFKQRNNIDNEAVIKLISQMQEVIDEVHRAKCLIVDLNELNVLVGHKFDKTYFIDVDSYQTPRYRATAIMESIRDQSIKNNKWTEDSDWYSFAILAFQLLIGIHPFKGSHPDYKPNEWLKRMKDGVSVLDPKSSLPPICNDFSVIPPSHMAWFKEVFLKNLRCHPPKVGDITLVVAVPSIFNIVKSSGQFDIETVEECKENIVDIFNFLGLNYMITPRYIYKGKSQLPIDIIGYEKILMCETSNTPVICKLKDGVMYIEDDKGKDVSNVAAKDMMHRNGCVYTVNGIKLLENSFIQLGDKIIHSTRHAGNVMELATQVFEGVIFQDFTGKKHITLPYEKGKCLILHIPELDGYRLLHARSERNVCGVMAEKGGIYYCIILTFNEEFTGYSVRSTKDVSYSEINLTVLPSGVTVMAGPTSAEIFKGSNVKTFDNPPFNSTTKLINYSGSVYYVDGKKIVSAKTKK